MVTILSANASDTGAPTFLCTNAMSGELVATLDAADASLTLGQVRTSVALARDIEARMVRLLVGTVPLDQPDEELIAGLVRT